MKTGHSLASSVVGQPYNSASLTQTERTYSESATQNRITHSDIAHLFVRLAQMFGTRFTAQYGETDQNNTWLAVLKHQTPDDLQLGLRKISDAQMSWPPSAPEFKKLCQPVPSDYGLPEWSEAWREAASKSHDPHGSKWSHDAVKLAASKTGWWELQHAEAGDNRVIKSFEYHYEIIVRRIMANQSLSDEIPDALEHQARSAQELQDDYSEQQAVERMKAQGVNPEGGRAEFLKQLRR